MEEEVYNLDKILARSWVAVCNIYRKMAFTISWYQSTNKDMVTNGYLSICKLVELVLSLLYLCLCDLTRI